MGDSDLSLKLREAGQRAACIEVLTDEGDGIEYFYFKPRENISKETYNDWISMLETIIAKLKEASNG